MGMLHRAAGTISILSMCAGQGRDLFSVLERHPRAPDVMAWLVELDDRNVAIAAARADKLDASRIEVVRADAGATDAYAGIAPAGIVLVCRVFGNISERDIETTVAAVPTRSQSHRGCTGPTRSLRTGPPPVHLRRQAGLAGERS